MTNEEFNRRQLQRWYEEELQKRGPGTRNGMADPLGKEMYRTPRPRVQRDTGPSDELAPKDRLI